MLKAYEMTFETSANKNNTNESPAHLVPVQIKIQILGSQEQQERSIKGAEPCCELFQLLPRVDPLSFLEFNDLCGYKRWSRNI